MLLPKVKTKVCVGFEVAAAVGGAAAGFAVHTQTEIRCRVVYGEMYKELAMERCVGDAVDRKGVEGWVGAVAELRARLVAQGIAGAGAGAAKGLPTPRKAGR